jgi:hypothetical protein
VFGSSKVELILSREFNLFYFKLEIVASGSKIDFYVQNLMFNSLLLECINITRMFGSSVRKNCFECIDSVKLILTKMELKIK